MMYKKLEVKKMRNETITTETPATIDEIEKIEEIFGL